MENKKRNGSMFIFGFIGIVFIAFGIYLFSSPLGSTVTTVIAVVDVLFGLALIVGAVSSSGKKNEQYFDEYAEQQEEPELPAENNKPRSRADDDYFADIEPAPARESGDPSDLAAREGELRIAAKRAAEEATRAKKVATAAVQDAKQAEEELRRAEEALAHLNPAEQRAAMRQIDLLAQTAAEKSEVAVNEAKRAKLAIRNAREAAELHSMAMDAAAAALSGDDEFAEFN